MKKVDKTISVVSKYLSKSGYNVAYLDFAEYKIPEFLGWYRGAVDWHNYTLDVGNNKKLYKMRNGLGMAKTVCEDMASLLLNEKVDITLKDVKSQELVEKVLDDNNFKVEGNNLIELSCALGSGAFLSGWDNGIFLNYIHGDMIFPLSWENGEITECAFGTVGKDADEVYFTLYLHEKDENGLYVIKTIHLDTKSNLVRPIEMSGKLQLKRSNEEEIEILETKSSIPLFQIIKPNIVNNYDKTNPLGMSIFGNAISVLKSIDMIYDTWLAEFETGRRRLFVKSGLQPVVKAKGNLVLPIDTNDTTYHLLDWEEGEKPIIDFTPNIRSDDYTQALNNQLNLLSRKCGLGENFYEFLNGSAIATATQIISSNSALFRNLKKFELVLDSAIVGLCRAIMNLDNIYNGGKHNLEQDITIDFDDSIIEDTEKEQQKAMAEYNAGIIDRVEYFVLTRNLTREQALKLVAEMDSTDTMKTTFDYMNSGALGV